MHFPFSLLASNQVPPTSYPHHEVFLCNATHLPPPNPQPPVTPQAQIPDMDPYSLPWQFPSMNDIDRENPGPAFDNLAQ